MKIDESGSEGPTQPPRRKLQVARSTLRHLSAAMMGKVAGGTMYTTTGQTECETACFELGCWPTSQNDCPTNVAMCGPDQTQVVGCGNPTDTFCVTQMACGESLNCPTGPAQCVSEIWCR